MSFFSCQITYPINNFESCQVQKLKNNPSYLMYANNNKLAYFNHQNQYDHYNFFCYQSPFIVANPSQSFAFAFPVTEQFSSYNMYPSYSKPCVVLPQKNSTDLNGNIIKTNRR